MPTRFYLPASGTAGASPTISADWEHSSALRRPMSTTKGSTALATQAYTPDAADHLVNGDALHVQFVSAPLAAQTIAAQNFSLTVNGLVAHANNAQQLTWKLFVWTAAGAVGSTLVAIRRAVGPYPAVTAQNRVDVQTTTAVTVGDGDRLVLEVGTGGTPGPATGGVQGHNASLRFGENGATDSPADNSSQSLTENPWAEFAGTIAFPPATSGLTVIRARSMSAPAATRASQSVVGLRSRARSATVSTAALLPATSGLTVIRARSAVAQAATRASRSVVGLRGLLRLTTVSTALLRRAVVTWAQFAVPQPTYATSAATVGVSLTARSVLATRTDRAAQVDLSAVATGGAIPATTRSAVLDLSAMSLGSRAVGIRGSLGPLDLSAMSSSDTHVVALRRAQATLATSAFTASAGVRVITIQLPFHPLAVINLGHVYRGDTLTLPIWRATTRDGDTIDLTDASLWFTAKTDLSDIDAEAPTIQVSTADGGIVVLDAEDGLYQVTLQSQETHGLTSDTVFTFDVQVVTPTPVTRTVRRGTLVVVCDVTRAVA